MNEDRYIFFHVDEDILPADELKSCIVDFLDMLRDAAVDCLSDIEWMASIEKGSVALRAYPTSKTETNDEIDSCLSIIRNDLALLQNGSRPSTFSQKTLNRYNGLAKNLVKDNKTKDNPTIRVVYPSAATTSPVTIRHHDIQTNEEDDTNIAFGSAFGIVKSVSAVREKYLTLFEESTGRKIKVTYKPEMLDIVRDSFENKVTVVGKVYYSADGLKRKIDATNIQLAVKDSGSRVLFSDLFGILAGANT